MEKVITLELIYFMKMNDSGEKLLLSLIHSVSKTPPTFDWGPYNKFLTEVQPLGKLRFMLKISVLR
jgi:hypothetical protein